jgi:hypothetical protein
MKATLKASAAGAGTTAQPGSRGRAAAGLRELGFDDYGELRRLHQRNGLPIRPEAEWRAAWIGNPAYEARRERWKIGWGLTDAGGALVGAIGNLPVEYRLGGEPLLAGAAFAWVVDAAYRGHALRLLAELMRQDVDFVVSTTVTAQSEGAMRAFGWQRVPAGRWDRSELWVTNCAGFARAAVSRRAGAWARWMAYPVAAALRCVEALGGRRGGAEPGCGLEIGRTFDERWDGFWERLQKEKRGVLLAVRTRETLQWHFRRSLAQGGLRVVASAGRTGLEAYAVFDRQDQPACGLRRLRLADWQALAGAESKLDAVWAWMLRRSKEEGIDVVEVSGGWLSALAGGHLAPRFTRRMPAWSYYYCATRPPMRAVMANAASWAPSSYDGDASI